MAKVTVALSRKWSAEIIPNVWETAEASFAIEDEPPEGVNRQSHAAAMRAEVKANVDAEMKRQKDEIRKEYSRPAAEAFAEEVGGEIEYSTAPGRSLDVPNQPAKEVVPAEEKPPLPVEETRTPIDDAGDELRVFQVQSFEVARTEDGRGDAYLKVFGGPWKRPWIPAWGEVANALFDDVEKMDLGVIGPPYPLNAFVQMGEYKGRPSPQSVVRWERIA